MNTESLVVDTERELHVLATALTEPYKGECLLCYVYRMLEHGCTGLRWAARYRDLRASRATALERRLEQKGGFCDCEIFMNGYELASEHWIPGYEVEGIGFTEVFDAEYPDPLPACQGARAGSTKGCALWIRQRRR